MHIEMLIAGHRIGGPCDQSVGKELVRNPFDGSVVGTVAEGGWSELLTCISAAHDSFQTWQYSELDQRRELLLRIADKISEYQEELVELAILEIAKPRSLATAELERTKLTFKIAADAVSGLQGPSSFGEHQDISVDPRSEGVDAYVRRRPRGVLFAITPYNWPFNLAAHKIAPALATGNTIVLKPSPLAAACSMRLAQVIHEAGCPDGVLNCWNGPTVLVSKALRDDRVKYLSFTGSAQVGWTLRENYPKLPMTLELGGNAPAIVCESADIDHAVEKLIFGAFGFAGQVCISTQNIFVAESCYEEFKQKFVAQASKLSIGNPGNDQSILCPMINSGAVDKTRVFVVDAVSKGADLILGQHMEGNRATPHILEGPSPDSLASCDEAFGPLVTLQKFAHLEEVAKILENSKNAIHVAIFTKSPREQEIASDFRFPGVVVNDAPHMRFDSLPYGGERASGWGREGVSSAMSEYTTAQTIVVRN